MIQFSLVKISEIIEHILKWGYEVGGVKGTKIDYN